MGVWGEGLFGVVVIFWRYPFLSARRQGSVGVISLYPLPDPQGSVDVVSRCPLPKPQKFSRRGFSLSTTRPKVRKKACLSTYYPAYPWVWVGVGLFGVVVIFWRSPFLSARPHGLVGVVSRCPLPDPKIQ